MVMIYMDHGMHVFIIGKNVRTQCIFVVSKTLDTWAKLHTLNLTDGGRAISY